jgi:hypothetical protein
MCPLRRYPLGPTGFSPLRRSPPQTLALGIAALVAGAPAHSLPVAGPLAVELGTPPWCWGGGGQAVATQAP